MIFQCLNCGHMELRAPHDKLGVTHGYCPGECAEMARAEMLREILEAAENEEEIHASQIDKM